MRALTSDGTATCFSLFAFWSSLTSAFKSRVTFAKCTYFVVFLRSSIRLRFDEWVSPSRHRRTRFGSYWFELDSDLRLFVLLLWSVSNTVIALRCLLDGIEDCPMERASFIGFSVCIASCWEARIGVSLHFDPPFVFGSRGRAFDAWLIHISLFLSMDLLDFACFISGCIEGEATTVISSTLGSDRFNCFVEFMILFLSSRQWNHSDGE